MTMNTKTNRTPAIKRGWLRGVLIIIPYFIVVVIFSFSVSYLVGIDMLISPEEQKLSYFQEFSKTFSIFIATILIIGIFRKYIDRDSFLSLGFATKNKLKDVIIGIGLGFLIMSIGLAILVYFNEIKVAAFTFKSFDILFYILFFILISVNEEILMRGYILNNFMLSFNKYIALVFTALLFSLMHGLNPSMDWFSVTSLFLAGILLGVTYIYTKNLWFPIALHFSWNFFQSIYGFKVSGTQTANSMFSLEISQNNRWNGGGFGFEGSYLCLIAECLLILSVFYYYRKKEHTNI